MSGRCRREEARVRATDFLENDDPVRGVALQGQDEPATVRERKVEEPELVC